MGEGRRGNPRKGGNEATADFLGGSPRHHDDLDHRPVLMDQLAKALIDMHQIQRPRQVSTRNTET